MSPRTIDYSHLIRMTDDTGLLEHARFATPRREHGYCTDDVSRGLLVVSREPEPTPELIRLAECYLTFLTHAQDKTGAFHNRLGYDRRFTDLAELGDWWGRALWGLGTAAARSTVPWIRVEALRAFYLGAGQRSVMPHTMAFAGLGAAEVLRVRPGDPVASALLADAAAAIGVPGEGIDWVWPARRLTYASASLAEVVIAAGAIGDEPALLARGLRMLTWLRRVQTREGRLSVIPAGGWDPEEDRSGRDQQSIEVAALADACATAAAATGDRAWEEGIHQAVAWFEGDNDADVVMWDAETGGGYDGLTPSGPNFNQGAESTLALLSTMQHARRLARLEGDL